MRGLVTIYYSPRQGAGYEVSIVMANGRGVSGIRAGGDAGNAAAIAMDYIICHCVENLLGGDVVGSTEVMALIPKRFHSVPAKAERKEWAKL
ncbi:hypothetical protein [Rhodoferax antarcticus]|uniref:hypothetical protein n=1 Tax=Rhodoferax antarcticus TaxID=81479 RepID=UPI000AC1EA7F|nr:hypothetical protein [Rhodoferax antarcticus]